VTLLFVYEWTLFRSRFELSTSLQQPVKVQLFEIQVMIRDNVIQSTEWIYFDFTAYVGKILPQRTYGKSNLKLHSKIKSFPAIEPAYIKIHVTNCSFWRGS
jgi:hypothetical protein